MRRGTTPTITVEVDADLANYNIRLALKEGKNLLVKEGDDLGIAYEEGKTIITCVLSQEDTLSMRSGHSVEVQIRAADESGYPAIASTIGAIPVERILQEGVLDG